MRDAFVSTIRKNHSSIDGIAAVATAGIAHGALIADAMKFPFVYVRSKPKAHGMRNMIEGDVSNINSVVLIEDLISTGGSSIAAALALQEAGIEVRAVYSIFNYGFQSALLNFKREGLASISLSNYSELLKQAVLEGFVEEVHIENLNNWRRDPENWNPRERF